MPPRRDIKSILIIGSGPIIIGQACEFDYSGTQACKALKAEGYKVILVNSNPATIMTDPEMAHVTYIEPLVQEFLERIIENERPDALLPTLGGQTALNLACELHESGVLDKYGVELIGANYEAIVKAENRDLFKRAIMNINLEIPKSGYAKDIDEAWQIVEELGFPVIIRPSFTLGGTGGNVAYNRDEFDKYVKWGISASPKGEILVEEGVLGWKEFELEVMRDKKDNVVIVCSIENFDPMGVHTGDSITVAPAQTLTDKEYQIMRDAAIAIIREIGVETGGSNIQFAINPEDGRMVVIEMNPRVSRSSALASKATGFPIAKIAAKLAVGYTLDEIPNDITKETPASFEPTIDYVVVKVPRFNFEKFPEAERTLTTQMKSVGEAMAIGRTFKEALYKAIRSLENSRYSLRQRCDFIEDGKVVDEQGLSEKIRIPRWNRVWYIYEALYAGWSVQKIAELSKIDPWFIENMSELVEFDKLLRQEASKNQHLPLFERFSRELWVEAKKFGFSDRYLAEILKTSENDVRYVRQGMGIKPVYKMVDTCAAEFEAKTPYFYSTYEAECEASPKIQRKVVILGGGPNRIGQGIEFDYCCVHAAFALKEEGCQSIMINCNPETVSTDYDTSDRLYFEPLTFEDVLSIAEREKPEGLIVQFGGQTPLKLAVPLAKALAGTNTKILGTSPDAIDRAEDRKRFAELLNKLGLRQAENDTAFAYEEALKIAQKIGYPVVVRPSYVLGGQAMDIVYDEKALKDYMQAAVEASPEHPILVDKYLEGAFEIDVDAISDGKIVVIGGIMEQIEYAGVHSGDSSCALPPHTLPVDLQEEIARQTKLIALELGVVGLINIQLAIKGKTIYVLEVNPRASRTIPFVSKVIGVPLAKLATKVMIGRTLKELGFTREIKPGHVAVKEAVFPFIKLPGTDVILGPEMRSTGEVMGIAHDFGEAFAKSQIAAGNKLPSAGTVFISVRDEDKPKAARLAAKLVALGFDVVATRGTAKVISDAQIPVETVLKVYEGRPSVVDLIVNKRINFLINTVFGKSAIKDSFTIRRSALMHGVPYFTTMPEAFAAIKGISSYRRRFEVKPIQSYYADISDNFYTRRNVSN